MVLRTDKVDLTRADVQAWISAWKRTSKAKRPPIEDYIRAKVNAALDDPMIEKAHYSEDAVVTHAADIIISDLPSYGVVTSS